MGSEIAVAEVSEFVLTEHDDLPVAVMNVVLDPSRDLASFASEDFEVEMRRHGEDLVSVIMYRLSAKNLYTVDIHERWTTNNMLVYNADWSTPWNFEGRSDYVRYSCAFSLRNPGGEVITTVRQYPSG